MKKLIFLGLAILLCSLGWFFTNYNIRFLGKHSIHEDALSYKDRSCLVFYPGESEKAKDNISSLCANEKNAIFDYEIIDHHELIEIRYAKGEPFYLYKDGGDFRLPKLSDKAKAIISNYLRYTMKKEEDDRAYTSAFIKDTNPSTIVIDSEKATIKDDNLILHFDKWDIDLSIPLKYLVNELELDFGIEGEIYQNRRYVSDNRMKIAYTFDDGPKVSESDPTSKDISSFLIENDCRATFFVVGYNLSSKALELIGENIQSGLEYGSHTANHPNLKKVKTDDLWSEIMYPAHVIENYTGYEMTYYRPPYGNHDSRIASVEPLIPVFWDIDSMDWSYRLNRGHDEAVDLIVEKVMKEAKDGGIILFHDLYRTSVDAAEELAYLLMDEGYQIVSVSELNR